MEAEAAVPLPRRESAASCFVLSPPRLLTGSDAVSIRPGALPSGTWPFSVCCSHRALLTLVSWMEV